MLEKRRREDADLEVVPAGPARAREPEEAERGAISHHGSNLQFRELDGMGAAFGADFSGVRLHQGDGRAEAMGALALTQGDDVHFAAGHGPGDRALLGHELAHVVQQRDGRVGAPAGQGKDAAVVADPALEAEADRAGDAIARGAPVPAASRARGGGTASGAAIQRFDAKDEHKAAGDDGSGGREYVWVTDPKNQGKMKPSEATDSLPTKRTKLPLDQHGEQQWCQANEFEFRLTHGDIVMLSADLFDPRETAPDQKTGKQVPVKDSLFKLCAQPSSDPGRQLLTQDEIIYAIYWENPRDIRFDSTCTVEQPGGGPWALHPRKFSEEVKTSVKNRYLRLASNNRDHFNQPDETQKGPGGDRDSSGGAYRSLHENACMAAYRAGRNDQDNGNAYAHDAAAQHFITDAFSSGHIRTRRHSIIQFWDARYPKFFHSVLKTMEHTIAAALNDQDAAATYVVPESIDLPIPKIGESFRSRVRKSIQKMLTGTPEATFGDMLAKIVHDVDNEQGVWVVNDLQQKWQAFGDGHMYEDDKDNKTPEMTRLSVRLSNDDLFHAQMAGVLDRDQPEKKRADLLADVRAHTATPAVAGDKYGAEQVVPRADPDRVADNGAQMTTASSFEDLWELPIRTDKGKLTYGFRIRAGLQPGGAFYEQLKSKGESLETDVSGTNPRRAYFEGFLDPFSRSPKVWLARILADAD